jgi:argininosuccinate synthase
VEGTFWSRAITAVTPGATRSGRSERAGASERPVRPRPDQAASVQIQFDRGEPVAINGVAMPLVELSATLGTIAGVHDIGRVDATRELAGSTSRRTDEAPAAVVLHTAHRALQRAVTTLDTDRVSRFVALQYVNLVGRGLWFTPLREGLDAYVERIQEQVTGNVRVELFEGNCKVLGCQTPARVYARASPRHGAPIRVRGARPLQNLRGSQGARRAKGLV